MISSKLLLRPQSSGRLMLQNSMFPKATARNMSTGGKLMSRRRKMQTQAKKDLEYPYGLNPVNYSTPPPVAPTLLPPPPKGGAQKWLISFSMASFVGFGVFLYFNSDSEMYEYWKKVETGENIMGNDDDDDYDDDDEYEDDEE